jgi:hypothetical protein
MIGVGFCIVFLLYNNYAQLTNRNGIKYQILYAGNGGLQPSGGDCGTVIAGILHRRGRPCDYCPGAACGGSRLPDIRDALFYPYRSDGCKNSSGVA